MMGGIYELFLGDELRCHDIYTEFHKDCFRHSKVDDGDTQTHKEHGNLISQLIFFQIRKAGRKYKII
jgi:hypothetical protein